MRGFELKVNFVFVHGLLILLQTFIETLFLRHHAKGWKTCQLLPTPVTCFRPQTCCQSCLCPSSASSVATPPVTLGLQPRWLPFLALNASSCLEVLEHYWLLFPIFLPSEMVNILCQVEWAMGVPSYLVEHCPRCVCEGVSI